MLNKHINDFMGYYTGLTSPQYAVMLKGKWGSGKTYFIEEYKKTLDTNEQKYIYVSLYGVRNYDEIETKFFEVLHPILSNKKTVLASKFAKGLLKATLKIDLDDDGKADGSVSGQLPNLDKNDFLNTQDYILIFDDLERCSIPINDVLGYINYFVEHQDYKVIIIANEEELDKNNKEYKGIKEKLIGKTFELTSNVEIACDSFINSLKEETKALLEAYKKEIITIYNQSNYDNLRLLRQTLSDFERFYELILVKHKEKKDLIEDVLKLYFIFSFENKYGNYEISKIESYYSEYISLIVRKGSDSKASHSKEKVEETKYSKLTKKYNIEIYNNIIFDISEWENIISKSFIDNDKLNELLKNSKYYINENSPNWKILWNFRSLNEDSFGKVLADVEDELINFKLNNIIELRHTNAILINLQKYGLYKEKQSNIYNNSKKHLDYLYNNDLIDRIVYDNNNLAISKQFNGSGLEYYDEDNHYCKNFLNYLNSVLEKGKVDLFKKDATLIIEFLESDFKKVKELFPSYSHKAFLHYIDIKAFVDVLSKIDNEILLDFGRILKDRYSSSYNLEHLAIEIRFLNKLKKLITKEQKKFKGTLKGYNIETFIKYALIKAIDNLQKYLDMEANKEEVNK